MSSALINGPFTRYAKLRVAHAPGMSGTFSPPPRVSDPHIHHGTCMTHVPWCRSGSLTSGFLLKSVAGKPFPASRCMRKTQFSVSSKRPMVPKFRHYHISSEQVTISDLIQFQGNTYLTPVKIAILIATPFYTCEDFCTLMAYAQMCIDQMTSYGFS